MKKQFDFPYENILVLGLAKSGTAAAKFLLENGKNVCINDLQATEDDVMIQELTKMGAKVVLGSHPLDILNNVDIIVKNPGIPYHIPLLKEAMERKIPIVTEIEIVSSITEGAIIGITGSNGKTTTSTLIYQMLKHDQQAVKIAGNIGVVATEVAKDMTKDEKMVLELSSFQLLGIESFRPHMAVLLNIYEAHLDYHHSIEHYEQAKFNIFKNQEQTDYLIYNADQERIATAAKLSNATLVPFSTKQKEVSGAWTDKEYIYFKNEKVIAIDEIVLVGEHNVENILAAVSVAKLNDVSNESIQYLLKHFTGVEHRLQFVRKVNERLFYNDSKATNILATEVALKAFNQPTILLAGGLDRGTEFDEIIPFLKNVKHMILFGQTKEKLKMIAEKAEKSFELVETVAEAVDQAYKHSANGDVILLSPACASWDQFKTFEDRGNMFIQAVHKL